MSSKQVEMYAESVNTADGVVDIQFRWCRSEDVPICSELEAASYPFDEAASLSTLEYRCRHASAYFLCAILTVAIPSGDKGPAALNTADAATDHDTIVGFICGTKCRAFTHESMRQHEPHGKLLAIHSVVVAEPYRRRGIATKMLREYIDRIRRVDDTLAETTTATQTIVLLSKKHLLPFYINCGFRAMYVCVEDMCYR
jgi:GNAT superfamily N-acetyltransferase